VRFPPTATKEIQYLNAKGALTYTDIAGDPVLYGNLPPREISMKDVFRSGDSSKKFKIAEGQDRKSGSAGMPRPTSYAVFCLKKKKGDRDVALAAGHQPHLVLSMCGRRGRASVP